MSFLSSRKNQFEYELIDLLRLLAACSASMLLIGILAKSLFISSTSIGEICATLISKNAVMHSYRHYQKEKDAWVIASRDRTNISRPRKYEGCVVRDGEVDVNASRTLFDPAAREQQEHCIHGEVSLAPSDMLEKRWRHRYGTRPATPEEIESRRRVCTFTRAKEEVINDLRWRRSG